MKQELKEIIDGLLHHVGEAKINNEMLGDAREDITAQLASSTAELIQAYVELEKNNLD